MAINFTDSPADGATQVIGGRTYTYNSAKNKWDTTATEVVGPTATVYATVDNLPGTATTGDQAFVSGTNRLYIWNGSGWYNIALINNTPTISGASSSYDLATDGTATTVTITATDPEGLPITYSIASDTSGNIATVAQGTGSNTNVFTITPSTNTANAGTFSLTFRASDGVNLATAVSSFTLQFSVQNQRYTTALITAADNGYVSNKVFQDSSGNNHSITVVGDTAQNTFSPYRHGGYSTYFDGTGDYLSVADDASFTIGSGDFTAECWVYPTASPNQPLIFGQWSNPYSWAIQFSNDGNRNARMIFHDGIYQDTVTSTSVALNAWTHLALVKNGSTATLYVNGVSAGTDTVGTLTDSSSALTLGALASGGQPFQGSIANARLVVGTAVYTSAFTPPTEPLTAITNTSLLTCHLPYIADGSSNSHSITVYGNTKTEPFAPYDAQEYSASSHGGSAYFDGAGDRLTFSHASDFSFGTGDFTIEFWIKTPTNAITGGYSRTICEIGQFRIYMRITQYHGGTDGALLIYDGSTGVDIGGTVSLSDDVWHHVAVVRESGTAKCWVDGAYMSGVSHTTSLTETGTNAIGAQADGNGHMQGYLADFRVVKGTAIYTGTSAFTPPTAPLTAITNTSLLLPFDDATIIDKSQSVKSITLNGDTTVSSTQTKYLNYSIYFDGNDHMLMPEIELDSSDYTVECWAWISAQGGTAGIFSKGSPGGLSNITWSLEFSSSNNYVALYIYAANSGAYVITGSTNIITSSWNHIAVTRSGNETKLFINGTQDGSTYTGNYTVGTGGNFYLGGGFYAPTSRTITGYMSDFRVTKGLARYTANFTPPTAALQG